MEQVWLSGWYDPDLIDFWEEFVAGWENMPLADLGYVYFPAALYSQKEAKRFMESQILKGGGN